MKVDDALRLQLHEFATQVRKATGAVHAVIIVGDDEGSVCGIDVTPGNSQVVQNIDMAKLTSSMIVSADTVVGNTTGGKVRVRAISPDGELPLGQALVSVEVHKL